MSELAVIEPKQYGIEEKQANELLSNLPQIVEERKSYEAQYDEVIKMDVDAPETPKLARELRLRIRDNRTKGINVWHKTAKDYFLKGGQFVDAIKNREIAVNERMEENLEAIEKAAENKEKERLDKLNVLRIELIKPFVDDVGALDFRNMDEDVFQSYLKTKETQYNERVEAAKIAEEERIAKEIAEAKECERVRIENERLKKEAEEREALLEKERKEAAEKLASEKAEADRILAEEKAKADAENKRIQDEANARLEAERKAAKEAADKAAEEKAKVDAELQAKKDAEEAAEKERIAKELAEKKAAEKAAKAPVKKQLGNWVDGFSLPDLAVESEVKKDIIQKFEAFKIWAKSEIEKI